MSEEQLIETLGGDYVQLSEKSLRRDGTAAVRLIGPGWGSSGYYAPEVLERDGPKVFTAGTKMFWNHPTTTEEAERPEGSLVNLAGVLVDDARWDASGPEGPGLYANAKVFETFRGALEEIAPHIGVSIRAAGRAQQGEADGRKGAIITEISSRRSVDFVTDPGAGGRVVQMFEAAGRGQLKESRNVGEWMESRIHLQFTEMADSWFGEGKLSRDERIILSSAIGAALDAFRGVVAAEAAHLYDRDILSDPPTNNAVLSVEESKRIETQQKESMMEEKLQELQEALAEAQTRITALETDRARLSEALLIRDAQELAREALGGAVLPDVTRARLLRQVTANPPVVDGGLDKAAMRVAVQEAITAETSYLREAAGWQDGRIVGMGGGAEQGQGAQFDEKAANERMVGGFKLLGLSDKEAAVAVNGRSW